MKNQLLRVLFIVGPVVALLGWGLWLYRLWQPDRQVELHQRHFLQAVEGREWKRIDAFLADDFTDPYDHDKVWVTMRLREALRQFYLHFEINASDTVLSWDEPGRAATVSSRLRISGEGFATTTWITSEFNQASEPFLFSWRKQSWKPWDWQLVRVEHPLLARTPAW